MELDNLVVVTKRTELEELLLQHATVSQVRFHLESRGKDFSDFLDRHQEYHATLKEVLSRLPGDYKRQNVSRPLVATHQFSQHDILVVVGDPGLLVNVAKYIGQQPVICVNSNPSRFEDVFTTCKPKQLQKVIGRVSDRAAEIEALTMAEAVLDDGQRMLALNDLFIGKRTHVSAHYQIELEGERERHSSSGIIVSTGTGSTAWMASILAGAYGMVGEECPNPRFGRSEKMLEYFVREPWPSKMTGCSMVRGIIEPETPLLVTSYMSENGVIFSDGIEKDYIGFNAGASATIRPALEQVQLVSR